MSSGRFLGGLLIGGALGAIIGMLIAPRPGRETRELIQDEFNTQVQRSVDTVNTQVDAVKQKVDDVKQRTSDMTEKALDKAGELKEKAQDIAQDLEQAGKDTMDKLRAKAGESAN